MTRRTVVLSLLVVMVGVSLLATACQSKAALGTEGNPIVLAFVPSAEAEEVIAGAEDLTKLLSEKTGYVFDGTVPTSYAAAIEAMCSGKAHMGTLATFAYILANEKCGVDVGLVSSRYGSAFYNGQIIAGVDTGIETLADLKGKTMCWVDAASTSGYIIPRIMLQAAGIDPDADLAEQTEAGSHDNVALAVYQGDCDAGATYIDVRDRVAEDYADVMEKTKVIAESPEIPNDGLQFVKDFPSDMRDEIVKAIVEIMASDEGVEAMGKAYGWDAVVDKDDSFYDDFRAVLDASGVDVEALAD